MKQFIIKDYVTSEGKTPFQSWINDLQDKKAQNKLFTRLRRVRYGHFGDWKAIKGAKGLYEMREHFGCGYRIFYTIIDNEVVLLLAGSQKSEQSRTIKKAKAYLEDYMRRKEYE